MRVADLGCGSGFFTQEVAEKVLPAGKVYAVDIQKDLLERVVREIRQNKKVNNVEAIWGDLEQQKGSKLNEQIMDAVLLTNTLFQADDRRAVVREAVRIIKPRGSLLIVEWNGSYNGIGPSPDRVLKIKELKQLLAEFSLEVKKNFAPGEYHFGLLAEKLPGQERKIKITTE